MPWVSPMSGIVKCIKYKQTHYFLSLIHTNMLLREGHWNMVRTHPISYIGVHIDGAHINSKS